MRRQLADMVGATRPLDLIGYKGGLTVNSALLSVVLFDRWPAIATTSAISTHTPEIVNVTC